MVYPEWYRRDIYRVVQGLHTQVGREAYIPTQGGREAYIPPREAGRLSNPGRLEGSLTQGPERFKPVSREV